MKAKHIVDWLVSNVAGYLILWLIHVPIANTSWTPGSGDPKWVGGTPIWPISFEPWILIVMTIINMFMLSGWVEKCPAEGLQPRHILAAAVLNVASYLALWLLHVWMHNIEPITMNWIGGIHVWPIGFEPGIVIVLTIANCVAIGTWAIHQQD